LKKTGGTTIDELVQCHTEIRRLRGVLREQQAEILQTLGREYDKALEQERAADTDTRRTFCAGMNEAYKNALAIVSGAKEER
jgi:hypothetical protein